MVVWSDCSGQNQRLMLLTLVLNDVDDILDVRMWIFI